MSAENPPRPLASELVEESRSSNPSKTFKNTKKTCVGAPAHFDMIFNLRQGSLTQV